MAGGRRHARRARHPRRVAGAGEPQRVGAARTRVRRHRATRRRRRARKPRHAHGQTPLGDDHAEGEGRLAVADEKEELVPQKQSLFGLSADDVLDNALQNLDERQAADVTKKAAEEVVRVAVEKRRAEHRADAARGEMRALIDNANLLDRRGGDYQINSSFETATGTTEVQIRKSNTTTLVLVVAFVLAALLLAVLVLLAR